MLCCIYYHALFASVIVEENIYISFLFIRYCGWAWHELDTCLCNRYVSR
jgi:hypothetical protein